MAKIVQTAGRNAPGEFAPEFAHFNRYWMRSMENWNNLNIESIVYRTVLWSDTVQYGIAVNYCIHYSAKVLNKIPFSNHEFR